MKRSHYRCPTCGSYLFEDLRTHRYICPISCKVVYPQSRSFQCRRCGHVYESDEWESERRCPICGN